MEASLFDFFREVVLPRSPEDQPSDRPAGERRVGYPPADDTEARERLRFAMKLQQYTGPVQAKGLEDTAFYRYNVLLSVNEVGGDPVADRTVGRGVPPRQRPSRQALAVRHADHRHSRHEARRGRAGAHQRPLGTAGRVGTRGVTLDADQSHAAPPGRWRPGAGSRRRVPALPGAARRLAGRSAARATRAPQEFIERISAYMLKAVREAKLHTSWLTTNQAYEDALTGFVERILGPAGGPKFLPAFCPFQRRVAAVGIDQLAGAGRAEARLAGRAGLLPGHRALGPQPGRSRQPPAGRLRAPRTDARGTDRTKIQPRCCASRSDGRIKMFVTTAGLQLRRELPHVFVGGDYLPLESEITVPGDVVAFARQCWRRCASSRWRRGLIAGPRSPMSGRCRSAASAGRRRASSCRRRCADRTFRNVFTGEEIRPTDSRRAGLALRRPSAPTDCPSHC